MRSLTPRRSKVVGYPALTQNNTSAVAGTNDFSVDTSSLPIGTNTVKLLAIDAAGNDAAVAPTLDFIVTPKKVTLDTPTDGTLTNNASPTLSWLDTTEGDTYEVQAATDNSTTTDGSFAHPGIDVSGLTVDSYTPTAPVDATYYWHVRAVQNGVDGPWSDLRSVAVDTTPPVAVGLVTPSLDSTQASKTLDFSWTSPEVGATYQVRWSLSPHTHTTAANGDKLDTDVTTIPTTDTFSSPTVTTDGTYYWQVLVTDAAGNIGQWSPVWAVTVDTTAPAQVQLTSPTDGSFVTTGGFDFVWQAPEAGDHYLVEGSPDGVVDPVTGDFVTNYGERPTTTTSFTNSAPDGTYYWHVRAIDAVGNLGPWSVTWTVTVDSSAPAAVTLTAPVDNADLSAHTLAFTWTSPEVGATYQVRWSPNPHTHATLANGDKLDTDFTMKTGTGQSFTTGNLPDGTYYWQVLVTDAAGNIGQWSPVRTVTLDTVAPAKVHLVSPDYGAYENTTDFALAWTALAHESNIQYTLQWATNPSFTAGLGQIDTIASTPYQFTGAVEGTYYWRVRATDGAGNVGAWSDSRKLTVDLTAPVAATLVAPTDHSFTNDTNLSFVWSSAEGNSGKYIIRISPDGARSSGGILTDGTNLAAGHDESYFARHVREGSYYWQVLVTDAAGNVSPWSSISKVTVDTTAPGRVQLTSPADDALLNTPSVVLTWQAVERHATYTIEWSASSQTRRDGSFRYPITNGPVPSGSTTTDATFTVPGAVDGVYYWHVVATDRAGNQGQWSHIRKATIDQTAPVAVALTAPADGTVNTTGSFNLSWTPDSSALNYTLELSHDSDFSTLIGTASTTTATDAAFTGIGDASFYWRVQATDAAGNVGDWSNAWTLTVAIPVPATPSDNTTVSTAGTTGGTTNTPDADLTEQLPTHALSPDSGLPSSTKSTKSKHTGTNVTPTSSNTGIAWWVWALSALAFLLLLLLAGFIFRRRALP